MTSTRAEESNTVPVVGTELQLGPDERPERLSRPRLQGFDYRGQFAYHVIIVTQENPGIRRPGAGRWSVSVLSEAASATGFEILAFCLMPDHLHLLTQGTGESSHLVTLVQRFKQQTAFHFKREFGTRLWQDSYYDRVLRKGEDLDAVADYILSNPVAAGLCTSPADYALSGGSHAVATPDGPS